MVLGYIVPLHVPSNIDPLVARAQLVLYKVVRFLAVAKDLTNRWTDMVLLKSEASYRSYDGFTLF